MSRIANWWNDLRFGAPGTRPGPKAVPPDPAEMGQPIGMPNGPEMPVGIQPIEQEIGKSLPTLPPEAEQKLLGGAGQPGMAPGKLSPIEQWHMAAQGAMNDGSWQKIIPQNQDTSGGVRGAGVDPLLQKLMGSQNAADILAAHRQASASLRRPEYLAGLPGAVRIGANNQVDDSGLGQAAQLAQGNLDKAFFGAMQQAGEGEKLGLEKSKAALQEYGQKVTNPMEWAGKKDIADSGNIAELAKAEMGAQSHERVAEIQRKAASQQAVNQAILAAQAQGRTMTPQEQRNLLDTNKALESEFRGGAPAPLPSSYQDAAKNRLGVAPIGIPNSPSAPVGVAEKPKAKSLEETAKAQQGQINVQDLISRAMGRQVGPGGQATGGKYDINTIASELSKIDPSLLQDADIQALSSELLKSSGKHKNDLMTDAAKMYMKQSRAAGDDKGSGTWKFSMGDPVASALGIPGLGGRQMAMENPAMGKITGIEGLFPSESGTANLGFPGAGRINWTQQGRGDARKQALVMERLLNSILQSGQ